MHFDIIDGKFWIQYDGTDRPVVAELEAAGVPREDIVLAWHPSGDRPRHGVRRQLDARFAPARPGP